MSPLHGLRSCGYDVDITHLRLYRVYIRKHPCGGRHSYEIRRDDSSVTFAAFEMNYLSLLLLSIATVPVFSSNRTCRYTPGDKEWPSPDEWSRLNGTVGGRLVATIPQASVCHTSPYSNYDETECEALAASWTLPTTLYVTSLPECDSDTCQQAVPCPTKRPRPRRSGSRLTCCLHTAVK